MNTKKVIFYVIIWIILAIIAFLFTTANKQEQEKTSQTNLSKPMQIWLYWEKEETFNSLLTKYFEASKIKFPYEIKEFVSYESYSQALKNSLVTWNFPDIFSLPNDDAKLKNELSPIINAFSPEQIPSDELVKNYETIFVNDLTISDSWIDYIIWVPLWYEIPLFYYDIRFFKGEDLTTWASFNSAVSSLREKNDKIIPVWIWTWTWVKHSSDLFSQFILQDWLNSFSSLDEKKIETSIWRYSYFWNVLWDNKFSSKAKVLEFRNEDNFNLFSRWEVWWVFGYPNDIANIKENGFRKSFLRAESFPQYSLWTNKVFAKYNFLSLYSASPNKLQSIEFLKFLMTDEGFEEYLNLEKYKLPSKTTLLNKFLSKKLDESYLIKFSDFYSWEAELTTFDKLSKTIFDNEIPNILDKVRIKVEIQQLNSIIKCKYSQVVELTNLKTTCK